MTEAIRNEADRCLDKIASLSGELRLYESQAEKEFEAIREKYQDAISDLKEGIKETEKALIDLMKENRQTLFDGTDTIRLPGGLLLYGSKPQVSIPRDAKEKIKAQGWAQEAIRVSETIDRSIVEKWPVERLVMIGAKRKNVETFNYELNSRK